MPLNITELLGHPLVQTVVLTALRYTSAAQARSRSEQRQQEYLAALKSLAAGQVTVTQQAQLPPLTGLVGEELARASALLDEAVRFATRDGVEHPEVAPRLDAAAEHLMKVERFYFTPAQLAQLPPEERELARQLAPRLASVRQALVNRLGGTQGLEACAVEAATLVQGWSSRSVPPASVPVPSMAEGAYSAYAPDMQPATGCVACARSHLAQVAAELEEATRAPEGQRQAWLTDAAKQLLALEEFDWTEEKIAASAPEVQELIRTYQPRVAALRQELLAGVDAGRLPEVATRARALQMEFAARAEQVQTDVDRAFEQAVKAVG